MHNKFSAPYSLCPTVCKLNLMLTFHMCKDRFPALETVLEVYSSVLCCGYTVFINIASKTSHKFFMSVLAILSHLLLIVNGIF